MDYGKNQARNNQVNLFLIEATKNAAQKWPQFMAKIRPSLAARANCRQLCGRLKMFYIGRIAHKLNPNVLAWVDAMGLAMGQSLSEKGLVSV